MKSILLTLALVSVLLSPAMAGEGHDHGDEAPAGAAGPALPRFAAVSEAFELVGIVNGKHLAIYLDRFEDNSPVPDAKLELEVGGKKVPVAVHAPGEYEATLPEELKPGVTPVRVMLEVKGDTDLLAGEIDIHEQEEHAEASAGNWLPYAGGAVAVLAALAAVVAVMRKRGRRARRCSMKTRAFLMAALLALVAPLWAGEGHGHGDAPAKTNGNGPQRLPDGSVFLPKSAQHQLSVRTTVARAGELGRTVELAGRIAMDPNAGGKVQSTIAGRIEAAGSGLPAPGQSVRKGQVLAYVVASAAPMERASQAAQLAELQAARALAAKRLARLRELSDTIPRKEIEAAESEVTSLAARAAAVSGGLRAREALTAPLTGVIASSNVVLGQVVDARELAFEIVDPTKLAVEATTFDPELPGNIGNASLAVGGETVQLRFTGAARSLRDQALPLNFRAQGAALSRLAVGQPVKVFVHTRSFVRGAPLPSSAVMRNAANQSIVWVKTAPEKFEARVVTVEPLDGVNVAVTQGLSVGDRVATQGATLINQVR